MFLDIIAADDVERGKPEPDGFIAALGRIGYLLRQRDPVLADECLVVEDTPAGIEAGHERGHEGAGAMPHGAGERSGGGGSRARFDFRVWISTSVLRALQGTMMAAKLYQFLGSPFCAKVRKLLAFKGVEFEVVEVDYLERKELLLASGQMTVPAVTLDNG